MKKVIAIVLLVALVSAISIGATLAYLTDRDSEVNVFTIGDVTIDLKEEFEQNSTLIPGVKIEKKPTITNTGKNDAWVWLTFAIPAALDTNTPGSDSGSIDNVIHWNFKAATTEGYVTEAKVQKAIEEGFLTDPTLTADRILAENMTWNVMDSIGAGNNVFQQEIEGVLCNVYVLLYNKALKPNETTLPNIEQVYLDANIDIDPNGDWYHVENGIAQKLDWNSFNSDGTPNNPKIYVSAYAMQTDGFATVDEAYAAYQKQWTTVDNVNNGLEYIQPTTTAANP
jgi:predicted ribosomally synthesized peptide with SipW-like signal peptide